MLTAHLMLALLVGPVDWTGPTTLPASGHASYYNPGVMDIVWQNRLNTGRVGPCAECAGAIAMLREGDIGRKVWLEHKGEVLGPFMVVDCAGPKHYARLVEKEEVAELPYWLAQRWKMLGPIDVTVLDRPPEMVHP